jgi:hypothetical protein
MMWRPNLCLVLCLITVCLFPNCVNVIEAAAGKMDKVNGRTDDDFTRETEIPTSAPIRGVSNNDGNAALVPVAVQVTSENRSITTTNAPVTAPVAVAAAPATQGKEGATTEDVGEDTSTSSSSQQNNSVQQNDMKASCRAISRGIAVTTNTSIQIVYTFAILSTTATPLYTGIAVNNAVTNYLMDQYIKPYCTTNTTTNTNNNNSNNKNLRRRRTLYDDSRLLSKDNNNSSSRSTTFVMGDVRGVERGLTSVLEERCYVPVEDTGVVACHQLQTSNTIHFRNDYIATDKEGLPIIDKLEKAILTDIESAFTDKTIANNVIQGGETGVKATNFKSGTAGAISIRGEQKQRSTAKSTSGSRGLTRAGKAFLTLFILCLLGVIGYFAYKYGYPKVKEHIPNIRERLSRPRNAAVSNTDRSFGAERVNPFAALYERIQRKVPNEVNRPYDFIVSESKFDRNDSHVVISDTIESSSTDGYGTEMILEDLQEDEIRLSPESASPSEHNYRFTPETLPNTKEAARTTGKTLNFDSVMSEAGQSNNNDRSIDYDGFSFSDVNIIIDDSSSYASTAPPNMFAASVPITRPYSVPDTVNL